MKQFIDWPAAIVGVDISEAIDACRRNFPERRNLTLIQADLRRLPFADELFDVIWSHGVLHHTPDTFESLRAVVRHLKPGGFLVCYLYRRKGPIREFSDDYLRREISALDAPAAWRRMEALTSLARSLARVSGELVVEEDLPELGIKRGTYVPQRFIYQHIMKCFWNDALSFDDNVTVNFDWYHPRYAHRHTVGEVRAWLPELRLDPVSVHESDSGIAVVARTMAARQ
jgi:SAM-dependent methyltransferase